MIFKRQFFFLPFIWAPLIGYFAFTFLNVGFYNFLAAWTWLSIICVLFDKLGKKQRINFPKYLKFLLIFVMYTIISDYLLVEKPINLKYLYSNRLASGFLAALLAENINVDKCFIKKAIRVSVIFLIIAFVIILFQQLIDPVFFVNIYDENILKKIGNIQSYEKRLPSIYSWTNLLDINFGFIGIATLLLSIYLLKKRKDVFIVLIITIILIFSFLSRGRWIMINASLTIAIYFIYKKFSIRNIIRNMLVLYLGVFFAIQLLEFAHIPVQKIINDRILERNKGGLEEGSAGTRIYAFVVFAKLFPEHPILGKGMLHSFGGHSKDTELVAALKGRSSQIHVGYLSLLYYYGIVGAIPFLLFLYFIMKKLYFEAKSSNFWGAFFVYLGFVLANWTLVNFTILYYGLIIALVFHNYYYNKTITKKQRIAIK